jgi:hypothetical protein
MRLIPLISFLNDLIVVIVIHKTIAILLINKKFNSNKMIKEVPLILGYDNLAI